MEHKSANAMKVIKRNGSLEDVHFDKITKRLQRIADRASLRVSPVKVAQKACASLYDNVTTAEIDALSSEIAASMSTEHPDYAILAAHIAVSNLHRNTTTGVLETFGQMKAMLREDVWAAIEAHADALDAMLDFSRDYGYDFFAMRTLERLYLTRVDGRVVERPQHMLLRVALGIWVDDLSRVRETYDTMSLKLATHATPTLFNAGLKNGQFSSCYLTGMDDSIEGIYKALGECAQISKWAGGIGVHVHNIRSRNAPIRGTNGKSSGIIPMLRVFNNTARYVNQCFVADTPVVTAAGIKRIADVEPGRDLMFTRDHTYRRVLEKYEKPAPSEGVLEIVLVNGQKTLVTGPHDILVRRENVWQFRAADSLVVGDVVAHHDDSLLLVPTEIASIRRGIPHDGPVYDLNVQDNHNYLVGTLGIVHNSGRRNGSFAMYIEPWHPDVFDFLDAKKNHGDEELRARDLFYAMWIPDLFMERVEAGATWSLMDPDACPGLADAYGKAFVELYEGYEAEGRFVKQIDAQKLWFAILTAQIETGTPYLCYKDACNEKSNQKNLGTIRSSNLCSEIIEYSSPEETAVCLTGDTKILTRDGWARLDQITNWTDVYCPYEDDESLRELPSFRKASLMPSGEKFVFEIAVSGSRPLRATANHLFLVRDDDGSLEWRRVDALRPGDELAVPEHDALPGYAEPAEIDPVWFEAGEKRLDIEPTDAIGFANYLRGVFAISGKISGSGYLHVGSSSLEFLYKIQDALRCFGVHGIVAWPGGRGRLDIFGKTNLERFAARIGFTTNGSKNEDPRRAQLAAAIADVANVRSIRYAFVVEAVTEVGVLPVFDLTVPVARHFVANGVVTHNCNLASVALPMFVDVDSKTYDYKALYRTTKIIARNLDRVIDKTYYPTEPARRSNFRHRPIGIGVQGLADVFQMLDMPFDSREALDLDRRIFETLYYAAVETSAELAGELGPYATYEGSPASQGLLQYDLWKESPITEWDWNALKALIQKQGLRNSLSIALMPTASTSQVLGNTECIEPITSNVYARRTMAGEFVVINRHLIKKLLDLGLWNNATRDAIVAAGGSVQGVEGLSERDKAVFKTAWELRQKSLIDLSASRGPFVCQSQSLNLFVTEPTFKKLSSMHFYAFRKGLKTGMYYLRTQSASKPVQVTLAKPSATLAQPAPLAAKPAARCEEDEGCLMCSA